MCSRPCLCLRDTYLWVTGPGCSNVITSCASVTPWVLSGDLDQQSLVGFQCCLVVVGDGDAQFCLAWCFVLLETAIIPDRRASPCWLAIFLLLRHMTECQGEWIQKFFLSCREFIFPGQQSCATQVVHETTGSLMIEVALVENIWLGVHRHLQ